MHERDEHFMRYAMTLAERGWGRTNPNPLVGAVIVKENNIVAEGWHAALGGPHAEIAALADAKEKGIDVRGATMYVTLEPCSHYGRTPPCSLAIIQAGLGRVVTAMQDPNPLVAGRGLEQLRGQGIEVAVEVLGNEARLQNEIFIHFITKRRPFVHYKAACSFDGKTASQSGVSRWISCPQSREHIHRWRARYAAVMVGIGTVLADDPLLTARNADGQPLDRQPLRIILDSQLRLPLESRLVQTARDIPLLAVCAPSAPEDRKKTLEKKGVRLMEMDMADGLLQLPNLLSELGKAEVDSVLLEGGSVTASGFLKAGLIDKFSFFHAPLLLGGHAAPGLFGGLGYGSPQQAFSLKMISSTVVGNDILMEAYPASSQGGDECSQE